MRRPIDTTPETAAASGRRLSTLTTVWAIIFAAVHFYWAAGGAVGTNDDPTTSLGASVYIAFIAVLGLIGAGVARGLGRPWGARYGYRRLRALGRLGAALLLLGVVTGVGSWIAHGGIGDDGAAGVVITGYFLLGGGLFAALSHASAPKETA